VLAPANKVWLMIGLAMHRVVNPVVMAVVFYLVLTPFGVVMRRVNPQLARRHRPDATASTYWITRAGYSPMDQQF
jgi:hypothetical protein